MEADTKSFKVSLIILHYLLSVSCFEAALINIFDLY